MDADGTGTPASQPEPGAQLAPGAQAAPAPLDVQHELSIAQDDQRAGLAGRPVAAGAVGTARWRGCGCRAGRGVDRVAIRPWQRRPIGVGRIRRREDERRGIGVGLLVGAAWLFHRSTAPQATPGSSPSQ